MKYKKPILNLLSLFFFSAIYLLSLWADSLIATFFIAFILVTVMFIADEYVQVTHFKKASDFPILKEEIIKMDSKEKFWHILMLLFPSVLAAIIAVVVHSVALFFI